MENLPSEIIELICKYPNLSIVDVVNFSSTCSTFREIITQSNLLWKAKYFQKWPETDIEIVVSDWYNECMTRKNFEKEAQRILFKMSEKLYTCEIQSINNSQLSFTLDFINSHKYGYYYLRDFLIAINSLPLSQSLTEKYYSSILLKFIRKKHYTKVWDNLINQPYQNQTLEKGAIFVADWYDENIRKVSEPVTKELDYIADLVKRQLLHYNKDHPLKQVQDETLQSWRDENIPDNMFEPQHCKSILAAVSDILFEYLKYFVVYESNRGDKRKCGIDNAVADRKATPLVLAVIYESVSRRLGVKIEILEFVHHCLLKWKESYKLENSPYHYISVNSKNLFTKPGSCPSRYPTNIVIQPRNMLQVAETSAFMHYEAERAVDVLDARDALELLLIINPCYFEWFLLYARCHMLHEMDARDLLSMRPILKSQTSQNDWGFFQPVFYSLETYQKNWEREHGASNKVRVVNRRVKGIEFAVGMIVRDKLYDNIGVIYGWEKASKKSQRRKTAVSQPLYKILFDDGGCLDSPQNNLQILHSPPFVSHPFIGRYFEEHCTTYYKPNKELQSEYPEDMEALLKILKKDREV